MDDNLAGDYLEREVQHKGMALFLYCADIAFNFTNVFVGSSDVDFHHVSFIFYFITLLVRHQDSDDEFGFCLKLNYIW